MMLDTDPLVSTSQMPPHTRNRILGEPNHFAFCPGGGVGKSPYFSRQKPSSELALYSETFGIFSSYQ